MKKEAPQISPKLDKNDVFKIVIIIQIQFDSAWTQMSDGIWEVT